MSREQSERMRDLLNCGVTDENASWGKRVLLIILLHCNFSVHEKLDEAPNHPALMNCS